MGQIVEFPSNGHGASGYLALPESGQGPGVVVIQEWWGLVPHITDVCDRFAAAGFVALAPDLYHGATTREPDEAGKLMMTMNIDEAARDMAGAVAYLRASAATTGTGVGVVGYCMGGGLALMLAARCPDDVAACAPYYGLIPWEGAEPDWTTVKAKVRGHYAADDGFFGPEAVAALQAKLDAAGVDAVLTVHDGVDHAFFNDTRPEVHDAATSQACFDDTVALFRETLG